MRPLLQVQNLQVTFDTEEGTLTAADSVSFDIHPGEVLGMVGESGCGKSVTALSILRLIPSPPGHISNGKILFEGTNLLDLPIRQLRKVRGNRISMIFQEPMTALSPLHRVGKQLVEAQQLHSDIARKEALKAGEEWLRKVGIPEAGECLHSYPFELSGGMRQRVMIAMALMLEPRLIIADEPTTALDVTIQAQILDLMLGMKTDDTSLLLITHDMGVVWDVCDRVVVMYASRIVEEGPVRDVFRTPAHPYTQALLKSMPILAGEGERLPSIRGQVPSLLNLPPGCNFAGRCPYATDKCRSEEPSLSNLSSERKSACFYANRWVLSSTVDETV